MRLLRLLLVPALFVPSTALAEPILTFGAGAAVNTVDASADFEAVAAVSDTPYVEDGLTFGKTGLDYSALNNLCGFAGCGDHPGFYPAFTGNYMYAYSQTNDAGYFTMKAAAGEYFTGLEFISGTGLWPTTQEVLSWSAYRDDVFVGGGSTQIAGVLTLAFSDAIGFDTLRYSRGDVLGGDYSPAFDTVRAQYLAPAPVPEPGTLVMLGSGLCAAMFQARRRRAQLRSQV